MFTSKFFKINTYKKRPQVRILNSLQKGLSSLNPRLQEKGGGRGGAVKTGHIPDRIDREHT